MSRQGWRTKEGAKLARSVIAAGGTVQNTGGGHLMVTGPAGCVAVGSKLPGQALLIARRQIEKYTGLRPRW